VNAWASQKDSPLCSSRRYYSNAGLEHYRQLGARLLNGFGGFIERRAVYRHKQQMERAEEPRDGSSALPFAKSSSPESAKDYFAG
jgi:hypothetical protein